MIYRPLAAAIVAATLAHAPAFAQSDEATLSSVQQSVKEAIDWRDLKLDDYGAPKIIYDGDPVTINFSSHLPEQSAQAKFLKQAFQVLEKMSDGKLVVKARWSGTVHSVSEGFEANRSGITDMSACFTFLNITSFPLTKALSLPGLFPDAGTLSIVAEHLADKYFRKEFERQGVYLEGITGSARFNLFSNRPITKLEDLQGLKVRSGSGVNQDVFAALGATPVNISSADFFSALQRGLLDAVFTSDAAAKAFRINEAASDHTDTPINHMPLEFCMSQAKYASLPADLQEVFYRWSRQKSQAESQLSFTLASAEARKQFIDQGMKYNEIDPAEFKRWQKKFDPVIQEYIKDGEAKGLPTKQLVQDIRDLVKKYGPMSRSERMDNTISDPATKVSPLKNAIN
ncbi:TRAP transporter substrate-binding protein [Pararhizobium mangrovi]|nr:TRAP transporter substrate-binding protein DctP [Pararhizobium mangrovi]